MQIFTALFKFLEELLTFYSFQGTFGPKLTSQEGANFQIFKIWIGLHNLIPLAKISLNAIFHLFIQIPRGIIDTLPILGYFGLMQIFFDDVIAPFTTPALFTPSYSRVVLLCPRWSCIVLCGPVWSYVVLCGPMWSYVVISRTRFQTSRS